MAKILVGYREAEVLVFSDKKGDGIKPVALSMVGPHRVTDWGNLDGIGHQKEEQK